MTPPRASLRERLLAEADYTHSLIAETVGERREYLAQRESLLREAADALPDGWVMVPVAATPEMYGAGAKAARHSEVDYFRLRSVWDAMLSAAPTPGENDGR